MLSQARRVSLIFVLLTALAACDTIEGESTPLPTVLVLPTITETLTPTITPTHTDSPAASATTGTEIASLANTTLTPSTTATESASPTATETPPESPTVTFTPSMTITDTPTRTPTETPSPTEVIGILHELAIIALSTTPLPTGFTFPTATATGFVVPPNPGAIVPPCPPPPGGFAAVFSADPTFNAQIGCYVGSPLQYLAATQTFERGVMVYVATSPASIYVLYNTGQYMRYDDTFVDGVDPVSGGETPPSGLFEPVRGFGKVWRMTPDVRNGLGWATAPETGTTATTLAFQSGLMIALPSLNQVAVLTFFNAHRLIAGSA